MSIKSCVACNVEFAAKQERSRFCSERCRNSFRYLERKGAGLESPKRGVCTVCGEPMRMGKSSADPSRMAHRACKRGLHGLSAYQRGCRCDVCRAALRESARSYNDRKRAEAGVSASAAYKRRLRGVDPEAVSVCVVCGEAVARLSRAARPMHRTCKESSPDWKRRSDESPRVRAFRRKIERAAAGSAGKRVFIQGPCLWCGVAFLSPDGVYCSDRCKDRMKSHKRSSLKGAFSMSPADRVALYERDSWTCQLCFVAVDALADPSSDLYPTVDHVVPQSHGGGHELANLRLAHRWCNSKRGDLAWFSDEEVKEAAYERFRSVRVGQQA